MARLDREIIRASALTGFRELVGEFGGDADAILAAAHVDPARMADPESYLPLRAYMDAQEFAAQRLRRPDFGLRFGQRQQMSMLGAVAIAIMNAPTMREAVETGGRYLHFHNPSFRMTLAPIGRTGREFVGIEIQMRGPARGGEQNMERALSSIHKSLSQLGGQRYRALEVRVAHDRVGPLSAYRQVFGITPLFGESQSGIVVDRAMLDAPRPGSSSQLRQMAETWLKTQGAERDTAYAVRVTAMTRGLLSGGRCSAAEAARALGVHERTLQRRLQADGTSFEKIKDDVRRSMAEGLLAQVSVPLSQIADMLDYANPSVFSRSCRRWFGEAPRDVRKRLASGLKPLAPRQRQPMSSIVVSRRAARALMN